MSKKKIGQVYSREDEVNKDEYWVCVGYVDPEDQDIRRLVREGSGIHYAVNAHMKAIKDLGRDRETVSKILWTKIGDIVPGTTGRDAPNHNFDEVTGEISRQTTWKERREIEREFEEAKLEALEILKGADYECTQCGFRHWRKSHIGKDHAKYEKPITPEGELLIEIFLKSKILEARGRTE